MTDTDLRQLVENRLDELMLITDRRTHGFSLPDVQYYDNKLAAGTALGSTRIALNIVHLRENTDSMIHETVAHELAHLVVHHCWMLDGGPKPKPHGREWQDVMLNWFGVTPETTHSYSDTNVKAKRQNRWEAVCDCQAHAITTAKQMKIAMGERRYKCRSCGTLISLTGKRAS